MNGKVWLWSALPALLLISIAPPRSVAQQPDSEKSLRALPWHLADIWWDIRRDVAFESLATEVTISNEVPSSFGFYIAPIGLANFAGIDFYGGMVTNSLGNRTKSDPTPRATGPGMVFSMWGERSLEAIRPGEGGYFESAGHEGDFVSARRPYAWHQGKYTYRLTRMDKVAIAGKPYTWVGAFLYSHATDENIFIGALRFKGENLVLSRPIANFVEVYAGKGDVSDIPKVTVTFGPPIVNGIGVRNAIANALYPQDVPDYADAVAKDGSVVITVGKPVRRTQREVPLIDGR